MIVKHIDSKATHRYFAVFWAVVLLQLLMLVINAFRPLVFEIDSNNVYHRGPFYIFFIAAGFLLLIYGSVYYFISKIRNPALRYFPVIEFLLPILLGLLLQSIIYGISLLPACFAVSFAGIVIAFQNECIYIDKLTGVYNRFEMDRELKRLQKRRKASRSSM